MKLTEISKKLRIAVVLSALWLIVMFLAALSEDRNDFNLLSFIMIFIGWGVIPVLVLWGVIWIRVPSNQK
jgi:hypothetical protein